MLTSQEYERKVRQEISEYRNPSISTAIDMIKTIRMLEKQVATIHEAIKLTQFSKGL